MPSFLGWFAATENGEIGIVGVHAVSFPLRFAGWDKSST
jgi:hypothetical protein